MSQDIDVSELGGNDNSLELKLKIGQFTAPQAVYTNFTWNLQILRSKTYNILKKYTKSSTPVLAPGAITISSWSPTNGYPTTYLK